MAPRSLEPYQAKRDFARTPEPAGRPRRGHRRAPRFVIQEHDARTMHWDLRLEHDGVLLSWAVPMGVPLNPRDNRLAIRTEDHPLEYLDFDGEIPAGEYGAGMMTIWDAGTYELEELQLGSDDVAGKVHVRLDGGRVHGRYMLVRTSGEHPGAAKDQWLLRRLDPPEHPDHVPMPEHVLPMLAKAVDDLPVPPEEWAFEVKWDGIRAVVFVHGGRIRIETRNLNDVTAQYPDLHRLGRELAAHEVVLDGEIVAFDERGRPSFQALQPRLGLTADRALKARVASTPVRYLAFDLLFLDGRDLRKLPYADRRRLLRALLDDTPRWQVPAHHVGEGDALLASVVELGLEGVVAKRLDSPYREGSRTGAWRKVKRQRRQEFVICGWTEGDGRRAETIGSLLLSYYDDYGRLTYAGSVGTGFSDATLEQLRDLLAPLEVDASPLDIGAPNKRTQRGRRARVHFVEPRHVCEVEYTEFTREGTLRHPSFQGLRGDKDPREVVREDVER